MTPREIERWTPKGLHEIVGCHALKSHLQELALGSEIGSNLLVIGASGTGKSASIRAYVRSILCGERDLVTAVPCGHCDTCRTFEARFSDAGTFAEIRERVHRHKRLPIHFFQVNCGEITEAGLATVLSDAHHCNGLRVMFLDEVHRLQRRRMDDSLLLPMRDLDAMWIGATIDAEGLEEAFLNRFSAKFRTELPSHAEVVEFAQQRCQAWEIDVGNMETLDLLARRSRGIIGRVISVLSVAAGRKERRLSPELVARFPFFTDELP